MGQEEQQKGTEVTELLLGVVVTELLLGVAVMEPLQGRVMELLQEVVMLHKEVLQATHHQGPTR